MNHCQIILFYILHDTYYQTLFILLTYFLFLPVEETGIASPTPRAPGQGLASSRCSVTTSWKWLKPRPSWAGQTKLEGESHRLSHQPWAETARGGHTRERKMSKLTVTWLSVAWRAERRPCRPQLLSKKKQFGPSFLERCERVSA